MNYVAAIQSQLAINKWRIQELEDAIVLAKNAKAYCDKYKHQNDEYTYHNTLKKFRAALKNYVRIQKTLKQIIKEI